MNLAAGVLDRRIEVQECTQTKDAAGDPIPSWATIGKRWARKIEVIQSETVGDGMALRTGDTVFILRWDTASLAYFPETHRFIYQDRIYEIVGKAEAPERHDGVRFVTCYRPDGRGARGPV